MGSILSIIATVVSSIALIGVAAGLILQNRQLRANQIQVMREMHLELMKVGLENPSLTVAIYDDLDIVDAPKAALLNLHFQFWETCYSLKTMTGVAVRLNVESIFKSEYARTWWATRARLFFQTEAGTKRRKEFLTIVESSYRNVTYHLGDGGRPSVDVSVEEE